MGGVVTTRPRALPKGIWSSGLPARANRPWERVAPLSRGRGIWVSLLDVAGAAQDEDGPDLVRAARRLERHRHGVVAARRRDEASRAVRHQQRAPGVGGAGLGLADAGEPHIRGLAGGRLVLEDAEDRLAAGAGEHDVEIRAADLDRAE